MPNIPDIQWVVRVKELCTVFARVDVYETPARMLWHPGRHIIHLITDDDPAIRRAAVCGNRRKSICLTLGR